MNKIGKAIQIVRNARGMDLGTLRKRSGVSVPMISLVEHGKRQPSLAVIQKLADGLGIPVEVLILMSQPTGGQLQSNDQTTRTLMTAIKKMFTVEDALRSKLEGEE